MIGTARQMAARRKEWSGTLMLIGQPAEEVLLWCEGDDGRSAVETLRTTGLCNHLS